MVLNDPELAANMPKADPEPGDGRRVGIVVDHPLRDLDGAALLAHHLVRGGHSVSLLPLYAQHLDLPWLDLDLLVLNYVRSANRAVLDRAERLGVALAVLDTEGGLLAAEGPTSAAGIARYMRESDADQRIALYMFWGSALRDAIVAETRLPPERALITGCPRFDLAHAPWASPSSSAGRDRTVLVNTNFPAIDPAHAVGGEADRAALYSVGFSVDEVDAWIALMQEVRDDFCVAVARISEARPSLEFIVRPHPFEKGEIYRERFAGLSNVRIRREGNVLDVLAQSAALLHVNCTTAIEALLCGVAPISLDFANRDDMLRLAALPTAISHRAGSLEEALELLDGADALRAAPPAGAMAKIGPFFGPLDGSSGRRAAASIAETLTQLPPRPARAGRAVAGAQGWAAAALGSHAVERLRQLLRPARRMKALDAAKVRAALKRYAAAEGVPAARVAPHRGPTGLTMLSLAVGPAG